MSNNANPTTKQGQSSNARKSRTKPATRTKIDTLIRRLKRPKGASISALCQATNWQSHSVRSALSRMRVRGLAVVRIEDKGRVTRYHIAGER